LEEVITTYNKIHPFSNEDDSIRVVVYHPEGESSPRHRSNNDFVIETWQRTLASPEYLYAHELWSRLVHTLIKSPVDGKYYGHAGVKGGRQHRPDSPAIYKTISRTLTAFYGAQYAFPVAVRGGALVLADHDAPVVGVIYTKEGIEPFVNEHDALSIANMELEEYNQWADGDVWAYQVHEKHACPCDGLHPDCPGFKWVLSLEDDEVTYGLSSATYNALNKAEEYYGERFTRLDMTTSA
jgi:hypothetical protein